MSFKWLPVVLALSVVPVLYVLHLVLLWMERRGWIFYRHTHPDPRNLGPAFMEIQRLLEPGKEHVIEEVKKQSAQEDDDGGPDKAGRKQPPGGRE